MILATQSGHIDTVQYLICAGADINLLSDTRNTALWNAVSYAMTAPDADTEKSSVYEKIIFLLISEGADPMRVNNVSVVHPLYVYGE